MGEKKPNNWRFVIFSRLQKLQEGCEMMLCKVQVMAQNHSTVSHRTNTLRNYIMTSYESLTSRNAFTIISSFKFIFKQPPPSLSDKSTSL